jgi:hypothetical protein
MFSPGHECARKSTLRTVVGLRSEQSAGLRPCTPCEGKTTQTPWSLPRALSSAARAGPRGRVLVRSIARGVVRAETPVCVGGGRMVAAYGGRRERSTALPASSRCSEGPATRSRPIRIKTLRVSLIAPAGHRCRAAGQPACGGAAAQTFPAPSNHAPHSAPAPWLHAEWRGKVEREEKTTAWCSPRIPAGGHPSHTPGLRAARVRRLTPAVSSAAPSNRALAGPSQADTI